jgi:hypothetical protein
MLLARSRMLLCRLASRRLDGLCIYENVKAVAKGKSNDICSATLELNPAADEHSCMSLLNARDETLVMVLTFDWETKLHIASKRIIQTQSLFVRRSALCHCLLPNSPIKLRMAPSFSRYFLTSQT